MHVAHLGIWKDALGSALAELAEEHGDQAAQEQASTAWGNSSLPTS
jgi:hypothetical protein